MKNIYQKHRTSVVTPQRLAIDFKRKKESISEEMRTLYVATTRAQKQMFIVDCLKDEQDLNQPLTLSSFYDNKGYSTWILRHFSEFPTPYFKLVKINEYWDPLTLPAASNKISYSKKNYSYPIVVEEEFSASQKKAKDVLPNYQQINLRGMRYGTNMHKMVELLNGQTISTESIKQCAKNIYFTIKENDIQKIMFLYQNSFFKQLQNNSTLYYELPFIGELPEGQSFGFMDLVAMNEKEIVIIDFKTDVKDEKELIEAYHEQLSLYKKVMQQMYPNLDVVTYLYSFTNNSFIEC